MGTLTEHMAMLVEETGVSPVTLRTLSRKLQEDELINVWGHGRSAAHLDSLATASLLVTTALMGRAKDISNRVRDYFQLGVQAGCRPTFSRLPPGLNRNQMTGSFGDALQSVLASVSSDVLVEMEIVQPIGRAVIRFQWDDNGKTTRSTWSYGRELDFGLGRIVAITINADTFMKTLAMRAEQPMVLADAA